MSINDNTTKINTLLSAIDDLPDYEVLYDAMDVARGDMTRFWRGVNNFTSNRIVLDIPNVSSLQTAFASAIFLADTEIEVIATSSTIFLDIFNAATNLIKVKLTYNPSLNVTFQRAFYGCSSIVEIDCDFDLTNVTNTAQLFQGCTNLETLRFVPNTAAFLGNYAFSNCPSLSDDSIISIANGLKDGITDQTLTLHATPKARTLEIMGTVSQVTENAGEENEVTYNFFTQDDNGDTTLNYFITTVKGWTLA